MTSIDNESQVQSETGAQRRSRRSLMTDPSTVAALLVVVSAAVFFVIALTNRHDHSTHEHPGAEAVVDMGAADPQHDHSTHDHSSDLGSTSVSRISLSADCRSIIGCTDAGPEPRSPGDRGGWAQFMTLAAVAAGLAFIAARIVRGARRATGEQNKESRGWTGCACKFGAVHAHFDG